MLQDENIIGKISNGNKRDPTFGITQRQDLITNFLDIQCMSAELIMCFT